MSAKHALLGLLLDRPAYPYQLADRLQRRLGPAWDVNSGQLYQLVKRLEQDGLIERVHSPGGKSEERHVYSITDGGIGEFERWFDQGSAGVRLCRRPLLVKVTFAGPERLADAVEKVDAYEQECAQQLEQTARLREELPSDGPLVRADHLLLRLSLSADVFQLEGELRWARHAREMLSWLAGREAVWPGARGRPDPEAQRRTQERGSARSRLFKRMAADEDTGENAGGDAGGGHDEAPGA